MISSGQSEVACDEHPSKSCDSQYKTCSVGAREAMALEFVIYSLCTCAVEEVTPVSFEKVCSMTNYWS